MKNRIVVDSCCDLTPEMKSEMGVVSVPLIMMLGDKEFHDDESLDVVGFMEELRNFSGKPGSASPPPLFYREAIEAADNAFVVTLSEKVSGSYNNAVAGNDMAAENGSGAAFVFDSKSASAGETLIAVKLHDLIRSGMSKEKIIETVNRFIGNMKTYCVFENYDNLQKNGRLNKITGSLIQVLNIRLITGADSNGEFALFDKCRGVKNMIQRLLSLIENSGKETQNENLVITHCNNRGLAEQLTALIKERFDFKNIYIVPTGGLSSLYADDKGIVLAF
ncbi:MAG: DegV family protein [Oscillospiraceae bacterium]|nr:DegV family protein [Oscillospiraceae bacterium]